MKTLKLNNGLTFPAFGLGTWKSEPGEVGNAVDVAIRAGYRHIDCAWIYGNESEIGEALANLFDEGVVAREDLWITSKLWNDRHDPADVESGIRETLDNLRLDYLDLYLMHWPVVHEKGVGFPSSADDMRSLDQVPIAQTWTAMEKLVDAGLARSIGVSNFSVAKLEPLLEMRIPPAVNQIELHPYLQQKAVLEFCAESGVALTAYSPLGSPDRAEQMKAEDEPVLLEDDVVKAISDRRGITVGQVLIAWALNRGTAVIPKSVNPGRIRENLAATEVDLTEKDMADLSALDRHRRYLDGSFWAVPGSGYTVANLWDE